MEELLQTDSSDFDVPVVADGDYPPPSPKFAFNQTSPLQHSESLNTTSCTSDSTTSNSESEHQTQVVEYLTAPASLTSPAEVGIIENDAARKYYNLKRDCLDWMERARVLESQLTQAKAAEHQAHSVASFFEQSCTSMRQSHDDVVRQQIISATHDLSQQLQDLQHMHNSLMQNVSFNGFQDVIS